MIPIAKPIIGDEEINAVVKALRSGNVAQGEAVNQFEVDFASFIGTKYAVAVNSGTAALHIALLSNGIGEGDEVITTPFTFISTANSILFVRAKPIFADISEDNFNINPNDILEKITKKTKAIVPVHLYGQSADMKAICEIAKEHNLAVIEDACQAHGAKFENKKVGSFGEGCFSFYPTKNMITGEGGMITTNSKETAEKARIFRSHGSSKRYFHETIGYNMRMTDIGAQIGLEQLKKLPDFTKKRQKNAAHLSSKIKRKGIITPAVKDGCEHVFHQYTIRVTEDSSVERDVFIKLLDENGVGTGVYYPIPIHKQPFYLDLGYNDSLPISENMASEVISLPVHPSVDESDLGYIANVLNNN